MTTALPNTDSDRDRGEIRALAFDAYGTLFDVHSVSSTCRRLFAEQADSIVRLWRQKQLEYTWLSSLMGRYRDFWWVTERGLRYALAAVGVAAKPEAVEEAMAAYLTLDAYPDVAEALASLGDRRLAILSNGSPRMLRAAVESAGLGDHFEHVISAETAQVFKPSPRFYRLGPETLGLDAPWQLGFVSSNAWDVAGAKAYGFWTCWVKRREAPAEALDLSPDLEVGNLRQLAYNLGSP
jgi:2-haloacid dehalogenase